MPAAIGHVVTNAFLAHQPDRHLRHLALQACCRGVDDQIVRRTLHLGEAAAGNFTQVGEFRRQLAGAFRRAISNDNFTQLPLHQRAEHAANRTAGAENEHALAGEGESQIVLEIGHQPQPIGVVAQQGGLFEKRNGVHGFGALRARREFVHQLCSGLLVRQRDIEALQAAGEQAQRLAAKTLRRNVE